MPGKIHVPVTVATDGFDKIQRAFGRLKGVAIGVTAALAGLGAASRAIDFTGTAIQGARDLERNYSGLESVFKDATQQMKDFGASASEMGLSMNEAAKATTFIGSVLKQSGFSIAETADLTEELVELGADLALTYGYDVQEALLGMTALFRGEYDPIEKFGVAMKQSEIDAEKAARGLDGLTGAAERFADQQIRVEFLMERAGDAMGAFERQSGNLTVQQMRLRAEFENIRDTIADDLLPPIAEFTGGLREIVQEVGPQLEDVFSDLAPVLEEMGEDALPLIQAGIEGVIAFAGQLVEFLDEALDPSTELGQSFQDLGTAFGELIGDTSELPTMEQQFDTFTGVVVELNDALANLITTIDNVKDPIVSLFEDIGKSVEATGLSDEEAAAVGIVTTIGLLATNLERVSKVVKKIPKAGLIGLALFGAGAVGSETEESLERSRQKIQDYEGDLDDLYYTAENGGDSFAYLQAKAQELGQEYEVLDRHGNVLKGNVVTLGERLGITANETETLSTNIRLAEGPTQTLAEAQATLRRKTAETYIEQLNLNAALAEFKILASTQVDTTTLEGILEASRGMGMGGGPVGWDAQEYLKGLGLITPDGKEEEVDGAITDFVGDFFGNIEEEIAKQAARLDLQDMGLSEALIDQIVGSEGWEELFQAIVDGGADMARQLQIDFNQTAEGIAELVKNAEDLAAELDKLRVQEENLEQQIIDTKNQRSDAIADATKEFEGFTAGINTTVDALETYERQIGRFESQTRSDLQRIEQQVTSAFDNGYLLEEAKNNLLEYARAELNALAGLQRQRDELLGQRNAAADTIFGIAQAVSSAGNITSLLRDVQDEVKEVQVKELFEDVVESADGLNGFKVTLERNYTDVITNTVSKSKALVNGFQDVIDRTRAFIDNLKLLREMGLDPFLFNQLVQAGAEAGGATAQALVEGGTDTVNEVNQLQSELEAMGVELGEQTYEVTKNSGEQFVSGIIDGMDAELERLGEMATTMATGFTTTFEVLFKSGMQSAFEGIIDAIRAEYQALIAELERELQAIQDRINRAEQQADDAARNTRVATGQSIIVEGVEVQEGASSIGPGNIGDLPASEQAFIREAFPELFPSSSGGSGQTVNVYNINASNPLDAYNASKGNVEQQSNFQSSNGNINVTLSGVGS